jgi:hypothetical protein
VLFLWLLSGGETVKEVKKITQKVLILLLDILILTRQVVRRVILPARSRKGNLLSSLLTFFVELLERIVSFEKSLLQRPVVFTHKYVRQGLIIAVGFLLYRPARLFPDLLFLHFLPPAPGRLV